MLARCYPAQSAGPAVRIETVSAVATARIESVAILFIECLRSTFHHRPSRARSPTSWLALAARPVPKSHVDYHNRARDDPAPQHRGCHRSEHIERERMNDPEGSERNERMGGDDRTFPGRILYGTSAA